MFNTKVIILSFGLLLFNLGYYYAGRLKQQLNINVSKDPQAVGLRYLQLFLNFFLSSAIFSLFISNTTPGVGKMTLIFIN